MGLKLAVDVQLAVPGTPTYVPQNDPLVALINLHTHISQVTPWGGPVAAARFGGLDGGGQGSDIFLMFRIHIWIPHEILSILSLHTWGKNELF